MAKKRANWKLEGLFGFFESSFWFPQVESPREFRILGKECDASEMSFDCLNVCIKFLWDSDRISSTSARYWCQRNVTAILWIGTLSLNSRVRRGGAESPHYPRRIQRKRAAKSKSRFVRHQRRSLIWTDRLWTRDQQAREPWIVSSRNRGPSRPFKEFETGLDFYEITSSRSHLKFISDFDELFFPQYSPVVSIVHLELPNPFFYLEEPCCPRKPSTDRPKNPMVILGYTLDGNTILYY